MDPSHLKPGNYIATDDEIVCVPDKTDSRPTSLSVPIPFADNETSV